MRFPVNIFASSFLLLSSTELASYEVRVHPLSFDFVLTTIFIARPDAIVARHENDLVLEARGEMTEFEARALLVSRAPPNGE